MNRAKGPVLWAGIARFKRFLYSQNKADSSDHQESYPGIEQTVYQFLVGNLLLHCLLGHNRVSTDLGSGKSVGDSFPEINGLGSNYKCHPND